MNNFYINRESNTDNQNALLNLENCYIYQSNRLILKDVNLKIKKGEFVYLIGKTGSGKTSLFKTLYADIKLKKGHGEIVGYDLLKITEKDIHLAENTLNNDGKFEIWHTVEAINKKGVICAKARMLVYLRDDEKKNKLGF